jgi:transketolase
MEFVGIENTYAESGSPEAVLEKYGLTAAKVAEAARRVLARKR